MSAVKSAPLAAASHTELGLLEQLPAVLMGLAKASGLGVVRRGRNGPVIAVTSAMPLRAFSRYNPAAMIVFDVDIGHGSTVGATGRRLDDGGRPGRRMTAHY